MIKKVLAVIIGTLLLAGCSVTQPNTNAVTAHMKTEEARKECYRSIALSNDSFYRAVSELPEDKQMMVLMMRQQADTLKTVVAGLKGTSMDPCEATNLFDAQVAEVQSKNDAVKSVVPVVSNVFTTGIITYGAVEFGKEAIRGAGDQVNVSNHSSMSDSMQRTSVENHAISTSGNPSASGSARDKTDNSVTNAAEEMPEEE